MASWSEILRNYASTKTKTPLQLIKTKIEQIMIMKGLFSCAVRLRRIWTQTTKELSKIRSTLICVSKQQSTVRDNHVLDHFCSSSVLPSQKSKQKLLSEVLSHSYGQKQFLIFQQITSIANNISVERHAYNCRPEQSTKVNHFKTILSSLISRDKKCYKSDYFLIFGNISLKRG